MNSQNTSLGKKEAAFICLLSDTSRMLTCLWLGSVDSLLQPDSNTWDHMSLSRLADLEQPVAVGLLSCVSEHHATLSFCLAASFS